MENRKNLDSLIPLSPLSMAILLALADARRHGYAIIKEIERESAGRLSPSAGSLYAALERLARDGLIAESTQPPPRGDDPRRRYYQLTELGRRAARAEALRLVDLIGAASRKKLAPGLTISFSEVDG